jgi:hypothetical protein
VACLMKNGTDKKLCGYNTGGTVDAQDVILVVKSLHASHQKDHREEATD